MLQVHRPRSWQEVRLLADQLSFYVFRGHGDASWRLATTFERAWNWNWYVDKRERERYDLWFFQGEPTSTSKLPPLDRHLEWLSLVQHDGGPTRLLDFTDSFSCCRRFRARRDLHCC